ncbi:hypothetical protein JCM10449v2_006167 [Rhodotorula kratochvilovae]
MDGYPPPFVSSPLPPRAGQKRPADAALDFDPAFAAQGAQHQHHPLRPSPDRPHLDRSSRGPSSGPGSAFGDAAVKDEDGEGSASGGGKRAKTGAPPLKRGNACTLCRKRKLRCDGVRPKCGTCMRLNHECVYGDPTQERIAERHRELEDRIRSLEAELDMYKRGGAPTPAPSTAAPFSPYPPSVGNRLNDAYPAMNTPHGLDHSLGGPSPFAPLQQQNPYAATPTGDYPQYSTQQLPIESPYLFQGGVPPQQSPAGNGHASLPSGYPHQSPLSNGQAPLPSGYPQQSPLGNGHVSLPSAFPPRDSEAFPLPPRAHEHDGAYMPPPQTTATSPQRPVPVQAHLQSFPFTMNPTPQLADLINPPSATSAPQYSPGADPSSGSSGVPGAAGPAAYSDAAVQPAWGSELPALELMLELADLYFATLHTHLPFLHRRRFLYTLHHPASLASPPSQGLIFAVLALSAAYHDSGAVRAQGPVWYVLARQKVDAAINAGLHSPLSPAGTGGGSGRAATFTVEMVQALCLLSLVEMGVSDHQRAFLSMGQAVRIAAMLGLHRMDEDRVAERTGAMREKRLRPPALHPLPTDAVLLEECRRTMCTVYVLDRFESATVGWPAAIAEGDVRVLLPCTDELFEQGTCSATGSDNPLWWPADEIGTSAEKGWKGIMAEAEAEAAAIGEGAGTAGDGEGDEPEAIPPAGAAPLPKVGTFAWLCRVVWLGGRIQAETYRASGPPAGGPWNKHVDLDPLDSAADSVEMDNVLEYVRSQFIEKAARKAQEGKGVDGPMLMILLFLNCMFCNLFHLRASSGLSRFPWDPHSAIYIGSSEYAMKRCWDAIHSMHEILAQLAAYENAHTSLHRSRATTYTAFVPYVLYAIAFDAKFAIGDWTILIAARDRSESVMARVARHDIPSGDDAFPPSYLDQRIAFVNIACDAMERIGTVWPVGKKFAAMIRGDCAQLVSRSYARAAAQSTVSPQQAAPPTLYAQSQASNGTGGGVDGSPTMPPRGYAAQA